MVFYVCRSTRGHDLNSFYLAHNLRAPQVIFVNSQAEAAKLQKKDPLTGLPDYAFAIANHEWLRCVQCSGQHTHTRAHRRVHTRTGHCMSSQCFRLFLHLLAVILRGLDVHMRGVSCSHCMAMCRLCTPSAYSCHTHRHRITRSYISVVVALAALCHDASSTVQCGQV